MKIFALAIGFLTITSVSATEKQISKEQYIASWKKVAIQQMMEHKIPASITLAQGILESGSGNSDLARKANNHFGIKCHDWTGEKFYKDDDKKDECFRVYKRAEESYKDHSTFLTGRSRYAKLFSLQTTDYKGWAHGLKDAGYATNPKYPQLLIDIIENQKLYELDVLAESPQPVTPQVVVAKQGSVAQHTVYDHSNKVKYIVARKGDTYYRIAKELELGLWQLYKYNDFNPLKDVLVEGDIIYIQPKRKRAKEKKSSVSVKTTTSLREVSQKEALKLSTLLKLNGTTNPDEEIKPGEKVFLRR